MSVHDSPWMECVRPEFRAATEEKFRAGDYLGFLHMVGNRDRLLLAFQNADALLEAGVYEQMLLDAFVDSTTINSWGLHFSVDVVRAMFERGDRAVFRSLGRKFPVPPLRAYRGVAGSGRVRLVRSMSWTLSLDCACYLATRFKESLAKPAVLGVTLQDKEIIACLHEYQCENELVVSLLEKNRPKDMKIPEDEMTARAGRYRNRTTCHRP